MDLALNLAIGTLDVATITLILSRSRLFRPLRDWLGSWKLVMSPEHPEGSPNTRFWRVSRFLHELITCTFCTSVWVSLALTASWLLLTGAAWTLRLVGLSALLSLAMASAAAPLIWLIYAAHAHVPTKE